MGKKRNENTLLMENLPERDRSEDQRIHERIKLELLEKE
jgi:hypothetical protein